MTLMTLQDLLIHELRDLRSGEEQLTSALPKMAAAAQDPDLKGGFERHLLETKRHLELVTAALEKLGAGADSTKCAAMAGIIKEGDDLIKTQGQAAVKDAALIGAAQRVEHYEIAGYGTAREFAQLLGHNEVLGLVEEILGQEHATNDKLTELAVHINREALGDVETRARTVG